MACPIFRPSGSPPRRLCGVDLAQSALVGTALLAVLNTVATYGSSLGSYGPAIAAVAGAIAHLVSQWLGDNSGTNTGTGTGTPAVT